MSKSNQRQQKDLLILAKGIPCQCTKSSFGLQHRSDRRSSPSIGFGTSLRESSSKQYISKSHARCMGGNNSPGAIYKTFSSIGSQAVSEKPSSPAFGFGNSPRNARERASTAPGPGNYRYGSSLGNQFASTRESACRTVFGTSTRDDIQKMYMDDDSAKTYYGLDSPPPNTYSLPSTITHQIESSIKSSPRWRLGTAERFPDHTQKALPRDGDKSYRVVTNACGPQVESDKKNSPKFSFGDSTREKLQKVLISREHAKASSSGFSPGPTTGMSLSSIGAQNLSYKRSAPGWGFGTSKRDRTVDDDMPGPGSYCI